MFAALLPKSAPFFAMLQEQNGLLRRMAGLLVEMLEDPSKMDDVHKEIARRCGQVNNVANIRMVVQPG